MAAAPLTTSVLLYYGGGWHDISTYVYQRDPIVITRGRPDEGTTADPSTLTLTLDNRDGRFSPRNPSSPLYGLIGRNTPIQVASSIPGNTSIKALVLRGGFINDHNQATTPDAVGLHIVGDIDLRAEFVPRDDNGTQVLISKGYYFAGETNLGYSLLFDNSGAVPHLTLRWSTTGIDQLFVDHDMAELVLDTKIAVRATLQVNNGSGSRVVKFYTSSDTTINGTWVQHGSTTTTVGTTSIFANTAPLTVGQQGPVGDVTNRFVGEIYAIRVLSGIGGTAKANPDFNSQTVAAASFVDSAGNTWTMDSGALIGYVPPFSRFVGEVSSWPVTWDQSGSDIYVPITAAGITRRLGQGTPPQTTLGMTEYVLSAHFDQSWPGDINRSLSGAATALEFNACKQYVTFGTGDLTPGANGMKVLTTKPHFSSAEMVDTGKITGWIGSGGATDFGLFFMYKASTLGPLTFFVFDFNFRGFLLKLRGDGTNNDIQVMRYVYTPDTGETITALADTSALDCITDGLLHNIMFTTVASGADTVWTVYVDGISVLSGTETTYTIFGRQYLQLWYNPTDPINNPVALGYITQWQQYPTNGDLIPNPPDAAQVASGYVGETAGARIKRLCDENDIPLFHRGNLADTPVMGVQGSGTLISLLQEAAAADLGLLYEPRDQLGLAYRTRKNLYNQTATVTLDYSAAVFADPPDPVDDDQGTHNDITVSRSGGGSVEAVLTSGALSTQAPPNGINTYATSTTVNVETDGQLADIARWLLHLGTVDAARYPRLGLQMLGLHIGAALAAQIAAVDIGSKVVISNLPSWLPPDNVNLLSVGLSENLGPYTWKDVLNCVPGDPYQVAVYGSAQGSATGARFDAENSTVGTGFNTVATSISIASAVNTQNWTTDAAAFPFDIKIAGERMTVTNIVGSGATQTFTVTRHVNGVVKSHVIGEQVSLFTTPRFGL